MTEPIGPLRMSEYLLTIPHTYMLMNGRSGVPMSVQDAHDLYHKFREHPSSCLSVVIAFELGDLEKILREPVRVEE